MNLYSIDRICAENEIIDFSYKKISRLAKSERTEGLSDLISSFP